MPLFQVTPRSACAGIELNWLGRAGIKNEPNSAVAGTILVAQAVENPAMTHQQQSIAPKRTLEALVLAAASLLGGMIPAQTPIESGDQGTKSHTMPAIPASPGDWPCWRGPGSLGVRSTAIAATQWSENNGILWKASVPGKGHASPI